MDYITATWSRVWRISRQNCGHCRLSLNCTIRTYLAISNSIFHMTVTCSIRTSKEGSYRSLCRRLKPIRLARPADTSYCTSALKCCWQTPVTQYDYHTSIQAALVCMVLFHTRLVQAHTSGARTHALAHTTHTHTQLTPTARIHTSYVCFPAG